MEVQLVDSGKVVEQDPILLTTKAGRSDISRRKCANG